MVAEPFIIDKQITTFLLWISAITIAISSAVHYTDMPEFSMKYLIFLGFDVAGIIAARTPLVQTVDVSQINQVTWFKIILFGAGAGVGVLLVNVLIGVTLQKLSLAPFEIYLFYYNASVAEEAMFRHTLMPLIDKILVPMNLSKGLTKGIEVVTSAGLFSLMHYWVYGNEPLLMLDMFLIGLIIAGVYVYCRHLLAAIIPHAMNNIAAAYKVVVNMSVVGGTITFAHMGGNLLLIAVTGLILLLLVMARKTNRCELHVEEEKC